MTNSPRLGAPVYVLNGPNLNLLGVREPQMYGTTTLQDIEGQSREQASELGLELVFRQTNHEGVMVDWIQEAREEGAGIVINPAGLTSVSIAVLDALLASELPIIEVHLTNIHRREEFRHFSYVSRGADAIIAGAGPHGYRLAVQYMAELVRNR